MFEDDETPRRNKTLSFAVISAVGLTLLCIAIGQGAAEFADLTTPLPPDMTAEAKSNPPKFNAVDYSATGAIKGQTVVISPCER